MQINYKKKFSFKLSDALIYDILHLLLFHEMVEHSAHEISNALGVLTDTSISASLVSVTLTLIFTMIHRK